MLSTVIQKIEDLFSKNTLLSCFYPILIFTFINLFLLFNVSSSVHRWVLSREPRADLATILQGSVIAVAIGLAAFFLSTISYFLRELVEGKHWPTPITPLRKRLVAVQQERLEWLDKEIGELSLLRYTFRRKFKSMRDDLNTARQAGTAANKNGCNYPTSVPEVEKLRTSRAHGEMISIKDMNDAVTKIAGELQINDADAVGPAETDAVRLDRDNRDLDELLSYAKLRIEHDLQSLYERRRLGFGDAPPSPTAAGNMVQAVATYAMSRYDFSIDLLWSRLQSVIAKDAFKTLQDAKAELDSLIALWWLALGTWIAWWFISALKGAIGIFWIVAFLGPAMSILLYILILASYQGFHDLLRSAVDLNRFDLLKALHLPLPRGPNEEKLLWKSLGAFSQYGDEFTGSYEHK